MKISYFGSQREQFEKDACSVIKVFHDLQGKASLDSDWLFELYDRFDFAWQQHDTIPQLGESRVVRPNWH